MVSTQILEEEIGGQKMYELARITAESPWLSGTEALRVNHKPQKSLEVVGNATWEHGVSVKEIH